MLGVVTIVFALLHASGDPATLLVSQDSTQADIDEIRRAYGLDQPLSVQYARFVGRAARGDLGYSYRQGLPVGELIVERLRATCELALAGLAVAVLLGMPLGIVAAARHGSAMDTAAMTGALLGTSIPSFWLGLLLIIVFGVELGWLPISGYGTLAHLCDARVRPGRIFGGPDQPANPNEPARGAGPGLHPYGVGEGTVRARRTPEARTAERDAPADDGAGPRFRPDAGRRESWWRRSSRGRAWGAWRCRRCSAGTSPWCRARRSSARRSS